MLLLVILEVLKKTAFEIVLSFLKNQQFKTLEESAVRAHWKIKLVHCQQGYSELKTKEHNKMLRLDRAKKFPITVICFFSSLEKFVESNFWFLLNLYFDFTPDASTLLSFQSTHRTHVFPPYYCLQ